MAAMDHGSFRDQLAFSIGFALSRSRDLLRRLLAEHAPDDARRQIADRVAGFKSSGPRRLPPAHIRIGIKTDGGGLRFTADRS
jgi:hypothetical protein